MFTDIGDEMIYYPHKQYSANKVSLFCTISVIVGVCTGIFITYPFNYELKPSEPTKVCRDGKLYEVTTEGNITIYDRKDFMTCEER